MAIMLKDLMTFINNILSFMVLLCPRLVILGALDISEMSLLKDNGRVQLLSSQTHLWNQDAWENTNYKYN
jgi:hypothetical protein